MEKRGAAIVICERDCTAQKVYDTVNDMVNDPEGIAAMSASLRSVAVLDCAERICDMIEAFAAGKRS